MSDLDRPRIVNPEMDELRFDDDSEAFRRLLTPEIVCNFRVGGYTVWPFNGNFSRYN